MRVRAIPSDRFVRILARLLRQGWTKEYEYDGFDAWIDFGKVVLADGQHRLTFTWDNWDEGEVEGPQGVLEQLGLGGGP